MSGDTRGSVKGISIPVSIVVTSLAALRTLSTENLGAVQVSFSSSENLTQIHRMFLSTHGADGKGIFFGNLCSYGGSFVQFGFNIKHGFYLLNLVGCSRCGICFFRFLQKLGVAADKGDQFLRFLQN